MQGNILVVDAVPTNRIVLRSILTQAGHSVLVADTAKEALETLRHAPVALLIAPLDLGPEVVAQMFAAVRALPVRPTILALSGATIKSRITAFDAGADDVVSYPLHQPLLLARVKALLRSMRTYSDEDLRKLGIPGMSEPAMVFAPQLRLALLGSAAAVLESAGHALAPFAKFRQHDLQNTLPHPEAFKNADALVLFWQDQDTTALRDRLQSLRALLGARRLPVIVAPSHVDPQISAAALNHGADDALCLGFDANELLWRTQRAIIQRTARQSVDRLTRLPDRTQARLDLAACIEQADTRDGPFAIMIADYTKSLRYARGLGRELADNLIIEVTSRIRRDIPKGGYIATLAPGRLVLLIPAAGVTEARRCALRLCHVVSSRECGTGGPAGTVHVTLEVGVAPSHLCPDGSSLQRADTLMKLAGDALTLRDGARSAEPQIAFGRPAA